jgi:hypothetical protein
MKMRNLLPLTLLLCTLILPSVASAQEKLTAEEQQAFQQVRERFNSSLDREGRIEPLIPEMFVPDFAARWAKEETRDGAPTDLALLAPGLQVRRSVIGLAPAGEIARSLNASFNFARLIEIPMLNHMIAVMKKGGDPDDDRRMMADLNKIVPKAVTEMFAADPVLKDFLLKQGVAEANIETVEDLRRVNDKLEKAFTLTLEKVPAADRHYTPEAKASIAKVKDDPKFGPYLSVSDDEQFGFPKGTRFLQFFPSVSEIVIVTKVGSQYKIVSVRPGSPD